MKPIEPKVTVYQPAESVTPTIAADGDFPVDLMKHLFITSDRTVDRLALEFGVPRYKLEQLVKTQDWALLKQQYKTARIKYLRNNFDDIVIERQSLVQRMETMTIMELQLRLDEIEDYFRKYGDFYARNGDEEILRDGRGQPIRIALPNDPKELAALKMLEDVRMTNTRVLDEIIKIEQEKLAETGRASRVSRLFESDEE